MKGKKKKLLNYSYKESCLPFQSFVDAAHALKERGAYKIYALATHGILSADAPRLIEESPINEVSFCFLDGGGH